MTTYETTQRATGSDVGATRGTRRRTSTETRKSFRTTEFMAFVAVSVLMLIAGYADSEFDIDHAWTLVAAVTVGYLLSRGIAKAGSYEPREYRDDEHDLR